MNKIYKYHIQLNWLEGRKGILSSAALDSKIEVATPPEFSKGIVGLWTPEHLFIASVSSCFMTTFLAIAENSSYDFLSFECSATGQLEMVDGSLAVSEITLMPKVVISDHHLISKAFKLLESAKKKCLISNSILTQIILAPSVNVYAPPTELDSVDKGNKLI